MKRMLILALLLLTGLAVLTAQAEAQMPEGLCRIVLRTEEGDTTLGTGVLYGSQKTLLTVRGCWAPGKLYALCGPHEHAVTYKGEVADSQLILLGLATDCDAEPMGITQAEYLADYVLYGAMSSGELVEMEVTSSRYTAIDHRAEILLTAQEGLLPGAVMMGDDDALACIVAYQYGESLGVYAALADATLHSLLVEEESVPAQTPTPDREPAQTPASEATPLPPAASAPEEQSDAPRLLQGFTVTSDGGSLTVDWSEALMMPVTEDTVFTVYFTIATNSYLTYEKVGSEQTSIRLPAIPGTDMLVWVVCSEHELEEHIFPQRNGELQMVSVPQDKPFAGYGLKNLRCGVTVGEAGLEGAPEDFLPQVPLTREVLSDRSMCFYFQTEDTYEVIEEDHDHTLLVTLYLPDGTVFFHHSGYAFMPEMCESDLWVADITELFETYDNLTPEEQRWPAGEYAFVYSIDGGEVGRISFTLD